MVFTFETSATNRTSERFSRGMHGHVAPQMMFSLKSFSTYVTLGAFFGRSMGHFHVKLVTVGRNEVFSTFLTNSTHALILNDCHMMKERFFINKPATAIPARHSLKRQRRLRSIMNWKSFYNCVYVLLLGANGFPCLLRTWSNKWSFRLKQLEHNSHLCGLSLEWITKCLL